MTGEFFSDTRAVERFHAVPLGEFVDKFAERLSDLGYARSSVRLRLQLVRQLNDWLRQQGLDVGALNEETVGRFLKATGRRGVYRPRYGREATYRELLALLRDEGAIALASRAEPDSGLPIEQDFKKYLTVERALSESSIRDRLPFVRQFLEDRFGSSPIALGNLRGADVTGFLLRHAHTGNAPRAKRMVGALRCFFRFLLLRGDIAFDLAGCVPRVAEWRVSTLPKSLAGEDVQRVVSSCDRTTSTGQRDYAVLLILARLGLRAGEVVAMTLDDIDWEVGELTVRGKGAREDRLPLPRDVGKALATYLRHGRPACTTRRLFVRTRAPHRPFAGSGTVSCLVERALTRAGIDSPRRGAHLLRHSLATEMLRKGASLFEIGEILRHRHPDTTAIYAKVDISALRSVALPWPGGGA